MVMYIDLYISIIGISLQRSLIYPLSLGFVVTALSIFNWGLQTILHHCGGSNREDVWVYRGLICRFAADNHKGLYTIYDSGASPLKGSIFMNISNPVDTHIPSIPYRGPISRIHMVRVS